MQLQPRHRVPHRPAPTPDPTRHTVHPLSTILARHPCRHPPPGRPRTRPTHAHGWAGGCCVVGAPTRSPLSPAWGPRDRPKGGLSPALSNAIDLPRRRRYGETAEPDETLPPDPALRIFRRPGATQVRPCSPPLPPGPDPPSTRAVLAAPLGVTRDTRKGRDARAAPHGHAALCASYRAFTQHTLG